MRYLSQAVSSRTREEEERHAPIRAEKDVSRELSDGDHVRGFLQLDVLLIDEAALVVHNHVGIHRAVLGSSIRRRIPIRDASAGHWALLVRDETRTHEPQRRGREKPAKPP